MYMRARVCTCTHTLGSFEDGRRYLELQRVHWEKKLRTSRTEGGAPTCSRLSANTWPTVQVMLHVFELVSELTWSHAWSFVP
jgi:hypothetical protein